MSLDRMVDPSHFCTGLGETTEKLLAFPLGIMNHALNNEARPGRIVQEGTGAAYLYEHTPHGNVSEWSVRSPSVVGTNIPGLKSMCPSNGTWMRKTLEVHGKLSGAVTKSMPLYCCRFCRVGNAKTERQAYMPGVGWTEYTRLYNLESIVHSRMYSAIERKIGAEGRFFQYDAKGFTDEERRKFKPLLDGIKKLDLAPDYTGKVPTPKNMNEALNLLPFRSRIKVEGGNTRDIAPQDLLDVGLIDDVDDLNVVFHEGYGKRYWPEQYRIRLYPVQAVPLAEVSKGWLPKEAMAVEKDVTAAKVLERLEECDFVWPDKPKERWVQLALVRISPW